LQRTASLQRPRALQRAGTLQRATTLRVGPLLLRAIVLRAGALKGSIAGLRLGVLRIRALERPHSALRLLLWILVAVLLLTSPLRECNSATKKDERDHDTLRF
jgi:hypothetical protein